MSIPDDIKKALAGQRADIELTESKEFGRFYSNRALVILTEHDVRLSFFHILGMPNHSAIAEMQCEVTIPYNHLKGLARALSEIVEENKEFFEALPKLKLPNPDDGNTEDRGTA